MNTENIEGIRVIVRQVKAAYEQLSQNLQHADVTVEIRALIEQLSANFHSFENSLATGAREQSRLSVNSIANDGLLFALTAQRLGPKFHQAGVNLEQECVVLRKALEQSSWARGLFSEYGIEGRSEREHLYQVEVDRLNARNDEYKKHNERTNKQLNENEIRIAELEIRIKQLEADASEEIQKIAEVYAVAVQDIDGKKSEIDEILGHVSGRAIAGDYEKSASDEKLMADWMRWGALACMGLIVLLLAAAVESTIGNNFEWQRFLSRFSLVFLLSVPAAYLARESAKHRLQQYQHLQNSLDMKAVSPFLASLPEVERHKIKADIASRIFGGRDFSNVSSDSYPINTHEILMELIKKLEVPGKPSKPEKSTPA
ncbi:hypothetical protein ACIOUG_02830 [Pseudomonas sp. NPDC087803]|uniref:hypothetical protein n=1 Tax=Pseudomonas sp. NPDC087803 TaxID=3364448 RepID=UPI003811E59D